MTVKVPLYSGRPTPLIVTDWPTMNPCAVVVVIVTVSPDSLAPVGAIEKPVFDSMILSVPWTPFGSAWTWKVPRLCQFSPPR